jgi:predicted metal-dependent hydrolase
MAGTIVQGARAKAYRPLPAAARRAATEAGLAAYDNADFFEAHELLEPAWMGTRNLAERELLQGVIKLAAAFVHGARSNPAGVEKNLRGARDRLVAGAAAAGVVGVDVEALVTAIDHRLAGRISLDDPSIPIERLPQDAQARVAAEREDRRVRGGAEG